MYLLHFVQQIPSLETFHTIKTIIPSTWKIQLFQPWKLLVIQGVKVGVVGTYTFAALLSDFLKESSPN